MKTKQISLGASGFKISSKRMRKRECPGEMNIVVPWAELVGLIQPHAPAGQTGRLPFSVETLLCMHFMQQWFTLSDPAMEEALDDTQLYWEFVQLDPGMNRLPDESTILRFPRLLDINDLAPQIIATVNAMLSARGFLLKAGTAVDATRIADPSSTKNKRGARDPKMHQTKKGNQWHFAMLAPIGVDADSGLVHTVIDTAANAGDETQANALTHGQESSAHGVLVLPGSEQAPQRSAGHHWAHRHVPGQASSAGQGKRDTRCSREARKAQSQRARQG